MMKLRNSAAILVVLLLLTCATVFVESKQITAPLILNLEDAPLKLKLSPTRLYVRVQNHSDKDVKWYKLGCVVEDRGKVKSRCAFETRHAELKAKDNSNGLTHGESFGVELSGSQFCKQSLASLAVVEVGFGDNSIWKNDGTTEPCETRPGDKVHLVEPASPPFALTYPERAARINSFRLSSVQNREVYAIPGNITSRNSFGTNYLIKSAGAKLVQTWQDVVAEFPADIAARILPPELKEGNATAATSAPAPADVSDDERAVLKLLSSDEAAHIDALAEASGRPVHELAGVLLGLEMRELVRQLPGRCFVRKI